MSDAPAAMCAGCGTMLALSDLRVRALESDGRVDFAHERVTGLCGPVIVAGLAVARQGARTEPVMLAKLAARMAETELSAAILLPNEGESVVLPARVEAYERRLILWALTREGGRILRAAKRLGVSYRTLYRRVHFWERRGGLGVVALRQRRSPHEWPARVCEAAILDAIAAGAETPPDIIARVAAPAGMRPRSRQQSVYHGLRTLRAQGAITRVSERPPHRYALTRRGAA